MTGRLLSFGHHPKNHHLRLRREFNPGMMNKLILAWITIQTDIRAERRTFFFSSTFAIAVREQLSMTMSSRTHE